MWEGLEAVEWTELERGGGAAGDVPELLRPAGSSKCPPEALCWSLRRCRRPGTHGGCTWHQAGQPSFGGGWRGFESDEAVRVAVAQLLAVAG